MRKSSWKYQHVRDLFRVTDYVSNGSFATLKENVKYKETVDYAILIRLADYSNNFDESKYVYVDRHAYDFLRKSSLKGGEIIMSNVGSIGKVFICPKLNKPMTLGPNSILIDTPNNNFYYYYFLSPAFMKNLEGIKTQATLSKFNKTQFKTLSIPVPPLPEQQKIVDYLDGAFAKIDQLKANAEKQLEDAQSLFSAALEEAMSPKEGWEEKTLGEIGEVYGGTTPSTSNPNFWDGDLPWISPAELDGSHYIYDSKKKITELAVKAKSLKLLPPNSVVLSSRAPIGKVAINKIPLYFNQGFKNIVCGPLVEPEFLYWWLWGKTSYLNSLGTGATFKEISKSIVQKIPIAFPSLPTQQSIVSHLDALSAKVNQLKENYKTIVSECDALKQALLREIFE